MLAILLVSIIQMCQRKQLSMEIGNIQGSGRTVENMPNMQNIRFFDSLLNTFINIENLNNNIEDDYVPPLIDINEELFFSTINEYYFYRNRMIEELE